MQTVKYTANSTIETADQLQQLPQTVKYMAGGANRDWFQLAMGKRNKNHADWADLDSAKDTPVVWSETRLHLQKAWLATSSEFVTSNIQYEKTNGDHTENVLCDPNSPYFGTYSDWDGLDTYHNSVHTVTDRSGAAALEYDEDVKVQLQAYNYGDWDLDGVTFLYTYAYGMKPVMNADAVWTFLRYWLMPTPATRRQIHSLRSMLQISPQRSFRNRTIKIRSIWHRRQCGTQHRMQISQTVLTDTIPQTSIHRMW